MGLAADSWAAIATGAAAAVSLIAAGFAFWQARIARGARDVAIDQAGTARQALELQRAQQHQADAPTFALAIQPPAGKHACWVKVTMISGPPGISVAITYVNGWARRIAPGKIERQEIQGNNTHRRQLIKNGSAVFSHEAPADAVAIWSMVIINSTEVAGSDRTWEHVERVDWMSPTENV